MGKALYRIEPYIMGKPAAYGVIETNDYHKARREFLKSWDSFTYGVKVYRNGIKLNMAETLLLFEPDGYKKRRHMD